MPNTTVPCTTRWWRFRYLVFQTVLLGLTVGYVHETALAGGRRVPTRIVNYTNAPVVVQAAATQLIQTYEDPDDLVMLAVMNGKARRVKPQHRVRYMNRINQQVAVYHLQGELTLKNPSTKTVEAMQVTTILLNVFQERIATQEELILGPLPPSHTQEVTWSCPVPADGEIYELYVVVTKTRFTDGQIWAPTEEMVLFP